MLVAGRNAKGCEPTLTITTNKNGYSINGDVFVDLPNDGLYVVEDYWYTLASPCSVNLMCLTSVGGDYADYINKSVAGGIRPVVCLKSDIQATTGTGDYDFNLVKE